MWFFRKVQAVGSPAAKGAVVRGPILSGKDHIPSPEVTVDIEH
jgi:hypothetical protein